MSESVELSARERAGFLRWATAVHRQRPRAIELAWFLAAYVAAAGIAELMAIMPDTGISLWPPSGLFVAVLACRRRLTWPWWVAAAMAAELFCNFLWFHNPLAVALGIFSGNALEALTGAYLLHRAGGWPYRWKSLWDVLAFVMLAAGLAPMVSATIGGATLWLAEMQPFARAWMLLWIGDATGVLVVAPLVLVALGWRRMQPLHAVDAVELSAISTLLAGGGALSLGGFLPFAFLTMPAVLWASIRFEFRGAAISLVAIAAMTVLFTHLGISPFVGDPATQEQKHILLQIFLAVTAIAGLIVATMSHQHGRAVEDLKTAKLELEERVMLRTEELRESEQRYLNIFESVAVSIWEEDFSAVLDAMDGLRARGVTDLRQLLKAEPALVEDMAARVRIKNVNSHTLKLFGASDKQSLMSSTARLADPQSRRQFVDELVLLWEGKRLHDAERMVETPSGRHLDVLSSIVYGGERAERTIVSLVDITDRRQIERELLAAAGRADIAQEVGRAWHWQYTLPDATLIQSAAMTKVTGHEPGDFTTLEDWRTLIHPDDALLVWPMLIDGMVSGGFSVEYRLRHKDGHYIWVHDQARVLAGNAGRHQVVGMTFDITEVKLREQQMRLLMREVNHRAKNILSLVQAIARQTIAGDPKDFVERFSERIRALAANQDLLVANNWQGVDLDSLARAQLAPFADLIGTRITLTGGPIRLSAGAAQSLGLALHELATNAAKYGALAEPEGHIGIRWEVDEATFSISWVETCRLNIAAPTRKGFGTRAIASMAKLSVDGEVELDYSPTGLKWILRCPVSNAVEGGWDRADHGPCAHRRG